MNNPPTSLIDWEHLHQISDDNQEFEQELLDIFIEDTQRYLEILQIAIADGDLKKVEQSAHHIKGASANIGITALQAIAAQLEKQAHQHQLDGGDELLAQMQRSFYQIQQLISNH